MQPEVSVSSGETYLKRANRIAENNPESNWQILQQTLLALGDYYVLSGRPNRASRTYKELWSILSGDEERLNDRYENLEKLNLLQNVFPPKYYRSEAIDQKFPDEDDYETGTVSFVFMVSVSGRVSNLVHVETQPPEFKDMQERVRRNLRHIVYRPRLEEGTLVMTRDVIFTHEFYYRPEDMPSKPSEDDSTSR
jgi:hypothetical protein